MQIQRQLFEGFHAQWRRCRCFRGVLALIRGFRIAQFVSSQEATLMPSQCKSERGRISIF
jgi:hypothetical protein